MLNSNEQNSLDEILNEIEDYVMDREIDSAETYSTVQYVLIDSLGCEILALNYPGYTNLLGPITLGTYVPNRTRVPGIPYVFDTVYGAFNIGSMIRWLNYKDTWLAADGCFLLITFPIFWL